MSKAPAKDKKEKVKDAEVKEHPDASYIKRDDIGLVIAKGMAVMYKTQPKNPVDFLAKWLLNYAQVEKTALSTSEHLEKVKDLKDKFSYQVSVEKKEEETKLLEQGKVDSKKNLFYEKINFSNDLTDQLQDLADFLKEFTSSTAVYIGKLVSPKKPIQEDDDDRAHKDDEAAKIIHFLQTTTGHEYLVDAILKQDQGLTFDVFRDDEPVQEEEQPPAEEEEGSAPRQPKEPEEVLPKYIYIKEVVREPRMHFYCVPRLGSYLAIRLEYESCLFEDSLDVAVQDYTEMRHRQREQDEEKRQYYDKIQEEAEGEHENEGYEPKQDRQWEEIKPNPFKTQKVSYVVCLNTMGQDREYDEEQIKIALRTVRDYRDRWEQVEKENLEKDILLRIKSIQQDREYKEHFEHADQQEMDRLCEEAIIPREGEEAMDEETKSLVQRKQRFKLMTKGFFCPNEPKPKKPKFKEHKAELAPPKEEKVDNRKLSNMPPAKQEDHKSQLPQQDHHNSQDNQPQYFPIRAEQWKKKILTFQKYNVIKMPRVFQTVFYLLKYQREDICERDTNMIEWKKAKQLLNEDFFKRIGEYNPFGPQYDDYRLYQKLKFIKKNIDKFEPENVDDYSIPLAKLFRWMLQAVDLRDEDVQIRRDMKAKLKEERRIAIEAAEERERLRENDLNVARAEFEAKEDERLAAMEEEEEEEGGSPQKQRRPFDEACHLKKWDEENANIEIPPEVNDDIDNDFDLEEIGGNE